MDQPRRILYIDDDPGLCRLVEKLLRRRGHHVVTAPSGREGLALAASGDFELIAVDHYMPEMDGLETLKALRALPGCPPIVYVTGSEESKVAVAALKAGAYDYVVKSVGNDFVELLEQAFAHALARVRLERAKEEAERQMRIANERLSALLHEANHRVANSLQLVISMIGMQARMVTDPAAGLALADTERRIRAIAMVHRKLYTSENVTSVVMSDYLEAIVEELRNSWTSSDRRTHISLSADPIELKTDKAISLGVMVSELVSNASKYAYPPEIEGEVRVRLSSPQSGQFQLVVEDDGIGMMPELVQGTGLGSRLLGAMAQSLGASITYDPSHKGCRAVLIAPV